MLPPIPNSKFIDRFSEEEGVILTKENESDKRKQIAYEAEVTVYRSLEDFEHAVVLHGLSYTNRQYALFKTDFKYDSEKPNKEAGECDFVVIGKNCIVIIEVSDVQIRPNITSNKKLKKAFKSKKQQGERTEELIKRMLYSGSDDRNEVYPYIQWFCAFLSISESEEKRFDQNQRSNIIFKESFTEGRNVFLQWWTENVTNKIVHSYTDEKKMSNLRNILIGLWIIDPQNRCHPKEKCSLGSNIMKVDSQLKDAKITYGFGRSKSGFENPDFVVADDVFKIMGISYLTKEQDKVFKSKKKFLWINGPAGSGKTILILGKAIQLAKTGKNKVVIFIFNTGDRNSDVYQKALKTAGIQPEVIKTAMTENGLIENDAVVDEINSCLRRPCSVVLLELSIEHSSPIGRANYRRDGLRSIDQMIYTVMFQEIKIRVSQQFNFFIDDEQCLLSDGHYDRSKRVKEMTTTTESYDLDLTIWICSDIAQSIDHMAPQNLPTLFPAMNSMMQVYSYLTLSRNLRNTCDISNVLSIIRKGILLSPKELSGHFVHGTKPVLRFLRCNGHNQVIDQVIVGIEEELRKVMDTDEIKTSDIAMISNTEHATKTLLRKRIKQLSMYNLSDTYSAEWPVVIFLMDVTDIADSEYQILHQLYLGVSRARVYCAVILYTHRKDTVISHLKHVLSSFELLADTDTRIQIEAFDPDIAESSKNIKPHTCKGLLQSEKSLTPDNQKEIIDAINSDDVNKISVVFNKFESSYSNYLDNNKKTVLHYSAECGKIKIVKFLIKEIGLVVHSRTKQGCTPLHSSLKGGQSDVARYLVEAGANVNAKMDDGCTPLHLASQQGVSDVARYLVEAGANVNEKMDNGRTPLHLALQHGVSDVARCLVEAGANVNEKMDDGRTPLHKALQKGEWDVARCLVEAGANVNEKTDDGRTPLHLASYQGKLDVARYLVEAGANVNEKTDDGCTPLHLASEMGELDVARYLVEAGAGGDQMDDGRTPLHLALQHGEWDVARYLVEAGANVNEKMDDGCTPLRLALQQEELDVARYLVEAGANVKEKMDDGSTALHFASQQRNLDVVRYLVEAGANVKEKMDDGRTPLHLASEEGKLDILRYLVEAGANVNEKTDDGRTPLHLASKQGKLDVARYLVEAGTNVKEKMDDGCTPLHLALQQGELDVARCLVEAGANVNEKTDYGCTPLHLALKQGKLDVARYLVEAGANVKQKMDDGCTPLHIASYQGELDVARYLAEAGANVNEKMDNGRTPLHLALQHGEWDVARYLVEAGANVNEKMDFGRTPLHLALQQEELDVARYLVEAGANVKEKMDDGSTALHFASQQRNLDVVRYLVEAGANVKEKMDDGRTPLHLASEEGKLDIVRYLVEAGANVNEKTDDGRNPLHLALQQGESDVARYLVDAGANVNEKMDDGSTPLH
ncbi:uncharacterized protein LOC134818765 [Bolinopsis microptera]|uniref:uncharacterized protein LOC134818765 n=1 Tax=Bolinopsis microptera TaxID=2820187 RepID=UPI00307ADA6B